MDYSRFELHPRDGVDPRSIPQRILPTGAGMPCIGLGTFGNDRYSAAEIAQSVLGGISVGYRLVDCAAVYDNEPEIGGVLAHVRQNGVTREELFITSKLWNDRHAPVDVLPALKKSLRDLCLDYLDMYFIHWPFANSHPKGASHDSRSSHARPYSPADYLATYQELEKAVDAGLIRHIGLSNMTVAKMKLLLPAARIRPAASQIEMHPSFQQPELFEYLVANAIQPIAFSPLGSPGRPARDTDPADVNPLTQPTVVDIAKKHGVQPAIVCLKWAMRRGQIPIPSSVKREKYLANLRAAVEAPLTDAEMIRMAAVDNGCRLIKGQVFLWESAKSWEELWDMDGVIAK